MLGGSLNLIGSLYIAGNKGYTPQVSITVGGKTLTFTNGILTNYV